MNLSGTVPLRATYHRYYSDTENEFVRNGSLESYKSQILFRYRKWICPERFPWELHITDTIQIQKMNLYRTVPLRAINHRYYSDTENEFVRNGSLESYKSQILVRYRKWICPERFPWELHITDYFSHVRTSFLLHLLSQLPLTLSKTKCFVIKSLIFNFENVIFICMPSVHQGNIINNLASVRLSIHRKWLTSRILYSMDILGSFPVGLPVKILKAL